MACILYIQCINTYVCMCNTSYIAWLVSYLNRVVMGMILLLIAEIYMEIESLITNNNKIRA